MKINQFKFFVILLAILLTFPSSETDAEANAFIKKVKGGGSVIDGIQTTDGNYISLSRADATGDTWIIRKVNPLGKGIWERTLSVQVANGGSWRLRSIAETNEGYVLVGHAYESDPGDSLSEGIVVALHSNGSVHWTKRFGIMTTFGGTATTGFRSVTSAPDGGFVVTGGAYTVPFVVLKFAPDGNIQWEKAFSDPLARNALSQSTSDNGVVLAAYRTNGTDVVKVDHSGNILWKRSLTIKDFSLKGLAYDPHNNGVVIVGKSKHILSLVGLNSNGKIDWNAKYSLDVPFSISGIVPTGDGGYAVTGTASNGFLFKVNAQKHLVFQRTIGGTKALSIFATSEGFTLFGSSGKSDLVFLSVNSDGLVPGCRYFHDLNFKAVPAGVIKVGLSNVSSYPVTHRAPASLDVTSTHSTHSVSTICE